MLCYRCGSRGVHIVGESHVKDYRLKFYECGFCGFFNHTQERNA